MNTAPSTEAEGFKEWVRQDLAAGKMTPEQADQALKVIDGQGLDQLKADTRSESERQYDKDFPVCREDNIPWPHSPDGESTPEFNAFRTQINTYFIDAGMTKDTAGYILKEADAFGYRSEKWTPEEHVLFGRAEIAKLECVLGDQLPQKLQLARQMVQKLESKRPGIVAMLEKTGLGNHSAVVLALANHCERLSKRSKPWVKRLWRDGGLGLRMPWCGVWAFIKRQRKMGIHLQRQKGPAAFSGNRQCNGKFSNYKR
jgi:hypothetical protein